MITRPDNLYEFKRFVFLLTHSYIIDILWLVKLTPDPLTSVWLRDFVADSENFDWDAGNREKNAKHEVSDEEIESILAQEKYIFAGRIIEPFHEEWRGLILGESSEGRPLALIFTRRGDKFRPISCRPMRVFEWRLYEESIKEHS